MAFEADCDSSTVLEGLGGEYTRALRTERVPSKRRDNRELRSIP